MSKVLVFNNPEDSCFFGALKQKLFNECLLSFSCDPPPNDILIIKVRMKLKQRFTGKTHLSQLANLK